MRKNKKGMSIKSTNSIKIAIFPKYKFLILRSMSPFVSGNWHRVTWTLLALFHPVLSVFNPGTHFPKPVFLAYRIQNGAHLDSEVAFCLGACLVVVLTGEGDALWGGEMDLTFPSRPACVCCLEGCLGAVGRLEAWSTPCYSVFVIYWVQSFPSIPTPELYQDHVHNLSQISQALQTSLA